MIHITRLQIKEMPTIRMRRLYVSLPFDYHRSQKRYPVLYMFDGQNVFYDDHATFGKSWGMKEYLELTRVGLIVVAIESNPEGNRRLHEYSPFRWELEDSALEETGEITPMGQVTMDWITGTLKKEIDEKYRTLSDRDHTYIAGSSMGGLMAFYAGIKYNDIFSGAAAVSPSFEVAPKAVMRMVKGAKDLKPLRLYMDIGTEEYKDNSEPYSEMFETAGVLSEKGAVVEARMIEGARHSEAYWEERIPEFISFITGKNE